MADPKKISQLTTTTTVDGFFVAGSSGSTNSKVDLGAAINTKTTAAVATKADQNGDIAKDFSAKTSIAKTINLAVDSILPTAEGELKYHTGWKCFVGFNGTKVMGFDEYIDYIASAASDQSGITTGTKLTNDTIGVGGSARKRYYDNIWEVATNRIRPDKDMGVGDTIWIDFDCIAQASANSSNLNIHIRGFNAGGSEIFRKTIFDGLVRYINTDFPVSRTTDFYVGPTVGVDGYFEIWAISEHTALIKNKSWKLTYQHR